jgi:hypothetical protein
LISLRAAALAILTTLTLVFPAAAAAQGQSGDPSGGAVYPSATPAPTAPANLTVPGTEAQLLPDGTAAAPADAPIQVQRAIWAANKLQHKPYIYGGGHAKFRSRGYDCSGTVSYALHGARLLRSPLDSSSFMSWGRHGRGQWITVYTNPGHAYAVIAGLRLDTSRAGVSRAAAAAAPSALESGPRWRPTWRSARGFTRRHPVGF